MFRTVRSVRERGERCGGERCIKKGERDRERGERCGERCIKKGESDRERGV